MRKLNRLGLRAVKSSNQHLKYVNSTQLFPTNEENNIKIIYFVKQNFEEFREKRKKYMFRIVQCLNLYVLLRLRVQNRRKKWNFPLNFRTMHKLSELYSGILQNY